MLLVSYNNVYPKIFDIKRKSNLSKIFLLNNILNFEALLRKSTFVFTTCLTNFKNVIIYNIYFVHFEKKVQLF